MLRIFLCSLSILASVADSAGAQTVAPPSAGQSITSNWGALGDFVGQYWLQSAAKPNQYVRFVWEMENVVLAFEGLDVDGNAISGRFIRDPSNGQIAMASVRNGQLATYEVQPTPTGIVLTGSDSGASVRQTYAKRGPGTYSIQFEEIRNGKWVAVRSMSFLAASEGMVTALGWTPRNPQFEAEAAAARAALMAAQPSFLDRLANAFQDGLVVGVQDGVADGVRGGLTNAINPGAAGDDE